MWSSAVYNSLCEVELNISTVDFSPLGNICLSLVLSVETSFVVRLNAVLTLATTAGEHFEGQVVTEHQNSCD